MADDVKDPSAQDESNEAFAGGRGGAKTTVGNPYGDQNAVGEDMVGEDTKAYDSNSRGNAVGNKGDAEVDHPDGGEDPERLTRNLSELLQELRVVQAGVQILFAFLLTLPFTNRFEQTSQEQRYMYFVALLATAAAAAMLIAPVSYHRLLFRRRRRPELVRAANRFTQAGLIFTVIGMSAAVLLIADFLLDDFRGWLMGIGVLLFISLWWFFLPLAQRRRHPVLEDLPPPEYK